MSKRNIEKHIKYNAEEWKIVSKKVFDENHQVLIITYVDCQHIHNHFAVSAYNLESKN